MASIFLGSLVLVGIFLGKKFTVKMLPYLVLQICSTLRLVVKAINVLKVQKFSMGFLGGLILVQGIFWGFRFKPGIFLGFNLCSHSHLPVTLNQVYICTPWGSR